MDTRSAEPTTVAGMLREEFLQPDGISTEQLAKALGTDLKSAERLLANERRLTPDEAAALARMFEVDEGFRMNLQTAHDRRQERMLKTEGAGVSTTTRFLRTEKAAVP